jgi:integrase
MVEDLRFIIEHLPGYSSSDSGSTGCLTLTALRDRALLLIGWTGALRRSELVALTTEDVQLIEGEGVNAYVRRSKSDQEAEGLVKGLLYGSNKSNYVTGPGLRLNRKPGPTRPEIARPAIPALRRARARAFAARLRCPPSPPGDRRAPIPQR